MNKLAIAAILLLSLATCGPVQKTYYQPHQFQSRLEWLRFCQHFYLNRDDICKDDGSLNPRKGAQR